MRRAGIFSVLLSCLALACGSSDDLAGGASGAEGQGGTTGQAGGAGSAGAEDAGTESSPDAPVCSPGGALAQPLDAPAQAVFITSEELAPSFELYAQLHTLLGIPSTVVTTEQICAGQCDDANPSADTAAHIKSWIIEQPSLRYVILGGDVEHVPARQVSDQYQNPILVTYSYEQDFFTDYYYADFSAWDTNGDGVYAEDGVDAPDYRPEIPVSRISASTAQEADVYLEKVLRYLIAYDVSHIPKMLLLSNVATQFAGMDIDGAWYFEADDRTLSLLPEGSDTRRLYSTGMAGAETNTVQKQVEAIEAGYNIIVHSGHGGVNYLTAEFASSENMSGEMAYELQNTTYPIFLSSACEAGTFAEDDAAGEMLMNAPDGGAIAYLGNAAIGLGLAGGMQMIDELLRFVRDNPDPLLGDALLFAHENMPEHDIFRVPVGNFDVPVVDEASYEWTQKSVTMFGDILIPVRKGPIAEAAGVEASWEETCEGTIVELTFTPPVDGLARVHAGGAYYEVPVVQGSAELHLGLKAGSLTVGMALPGALATVAQFSL